MMQLTALLLFAQVQIPPPRGYINDFAGVLDAASVARMEAVIADVKAKTRGEIVVVTLPDIGDRPASDVALQIGREWKVGPGAAVGDPARNLGVVVLVVPRKDHRAGTGHIFIATGKGAEGFLTDARVGQIEDAMLPDMAREDYGTALVRGVYLIAQDFGREFGVAITGAEPPAPAGDEARRPPISAGILFALVILLILVTRGRIFLLPFLLGGFGGGRGWGGGGRGGGGGGFGGGFGGFGGGGGFSGGGAGRSF